MQQAQHATRRGLLAGVALLPAVIAAPAVMAAPGGLAAMWIERERLFNTAGSLTDENVTGNAAFERFVTLETAIPTGPITCRADAAAKARMVAYAMEYGERGDGSDLASAVHLAEWLEHRES